MNRKSIEKRKYFRLSDLLVVGLVLLFAVMSFLLAFPFDKSENLSCEIAVSGRVVKTVDLSQVSETYSYTVEGKLPVTLEVSRDGVRFLEADCPDKLCVNMGKITREGQSVVCLPAQVSIRIVGTGSPELDALVG